MLPDRTFIDKGTQKKAGIAAYWAGQDTGSTSKEDIHAAAESYCRTNTSLISIKGGGFNPGARAACENA